jgi:cell division protease FtsH
LAGRIAEELIFGSEEITTGASNDIQKASQLILDYINKFGMDEEMGLFSLDIFGEGQNEKLVAKCREHMNTLYDETRTLIQNHILHLEGLTSELLEKESMGQEDITRICA